jgi:hypothetical protein
MKILQLAIASSLLGLISASYAQEPAGQPGAIDVPTGVQLVLQVRGEGFQIYVCEEDGNWKLSAPDATLFDEGHHALGIHYAGPRWRLDDGSEVQGKLVKSEAHAGTIPWLLLSAKSIGSSGELSPVDIVRRTDTEGGVVPTTGCDADHVGAQSKVSYSATYSFYTSKK